MWELLSSIFADPTVNILLAGAAGGLIKWVRLQEPRTTGLLSVLVGAVVAFYMSPIAVTAVESSLGVVIEMTEIEKARFGGFIVGSTAMLLVGAISELVANYLDKKKERKNEQS